MVPKVQIQKVDGQTGVTSPGSEGVLAIFGSGTMGTENLAQGFARSDLLFQSTGPGTLAEFGAYDMDVSENNVVAVRTMTSVPGGYSAITSNPGTGTSAVTAGADVPVDEYVNVTISIVQGGTVGAPGITYTASLDGIIVGPTTAVPNPYNKIGPIPLPPAAGGASSGVSVNLGAGTLAPGATFTFNTTRPQMNGSDLLLALEALRVSRLPWEAVLIDGDLATGTVGVLDNWLSELEAVGEFHWAIVNTRHKLLPVPTAESEGAFTAAMTTLVQNLASIRVVCGTDAGDVVSLLSGLTQPRPVSLALAARCMLIPIGEDAAFVSRGAIPNFTISDSQSNPKWHDEALYPGLDDQRLVCLRTFSGDGPEGVYINNPVVLSPSGSDYVFAQHIRTMNKACTLAFQILVRLLSMGVGKKPKDPQTGKIYIAEADAQRIETLVNDAFTNPLRGQVQGALFKLSRTDDLSSNQGATVTGFIEVEGLAYIKDFKVSAVFVKSL